MGMDILGRERGDENVLKLITMTSAQLCDCVKNHLNVYSKWINYVVSIISQQSCCLKKNKSKVRGILGMVF